MNSKIIVVSVVAILIIAGISVFVWSDNKEENGGWYAWDPTIGEVDYTKISTTPQIIDQLETMYEVVYGTLPSTDGVTIPDGKELQYNSLVTKVSGGIEVKSNYTNSSGFLDTKTIYFTDSEISKMKIISYGYGITDSYVDLLGATVWDTVVAAGNTTWDDYPDNEMINWSDGGSSGSLGSEYNLSELNLLSYLEKAGAKDNGNTYCLVVWGYIQNYDDVVKMLFDNGYTNVEVLRVDYYAITSFEYLLSVQDLLGQIVGIDSLDNGVISNFQLRYYVIEEALESDTDVKKVYLERADKKSPGSETLSQLCFDTLKLTNINITKGTTMLSDEVIVSEQPDYIFFVKGDTRSMDQRMRVTV